MRKLLGEQLDDTGAYPQTVWTDQFLYDGVDAAMDECARQGYWFTYYTDASLTTVSGTNSYAIPTTIQQVEQVFVGTPTAGQELTPVSPEDFANVVSGNCYTLETQAGATDTTGGTYKIKLFPTPTTTGTVITIRGIGRMTPAATATYISLFDAYHMFLVWRAVEYARIREENVTGMGIAKQKGDAIWDDIYINEIAPGGSEKTKWKMPWEGPH